MDKIKSFFKCMWYSFLIFWWSTMYKHASVHTSRLEEELKECKFEFEKENQFLTSRVTCSPMLAPYLLGTTYSSSANAMNRVNDILIKSRKLSEKYKKWHSYYLNTKNKVKHYESLKEACYDIQKELQ